MSTIFTKIISGEIPSYKIAESDRFYAFLDINPLVKGHVLVIPKEEVDYIFDVQDETYQELFLFAKSVASAIKHTISCKKVGIAVIGIEVPHAHIHLIPINQVSDMDFSQPKMKLPPEELLEIAESIKKNFKN